jgi:hypothetical protein
LSWPGSGAAEWVVAVVALYEEAQSLPSTAWRQESYVQNGRRGREQVPEIMRLIERDGGHGVE